MAEWFVGPIMDKIINACSDYREEQVGWQMGMELERLRENYPKLQAVVFAPNQGQINDKNGALNKWIWQLRDAIDEANDVLDEFEYMKHKEQLPKNTEETKKHFSSIYSGPWWVCVSNNFDAKEVIADMLELLKKKRPYLEKLEEVLTCAGRYLGGG